MLRYAMTVVAWLLVSTVTTRAETYPPGEPSQDVPMTVFGKLPEALKIRQHATTLDELVQRTHPDLVWNAQDLLWVMHDDAGNPIFAMNRAYMIGFAGDNHWGFNLLGANGVFKESFGQREFPYTRSVDRNPKIIAQDPRRGIVYQVRWLSTVMVGDWEYSQARNIFILCDPNGHWRLLQEGPTTNRGIDGASTSFLRTLLVQGSWSKDKSNPMTFSYTLLSKDIWQVEDPRTHKTTTHSMTVRQRLKLATEADDDPDGLVYKGFGPFFVVVANTQTLVQFIDGLYHCVESEEFEEYEEDPQSVSKHIAQILRRANPSLPDRLIANTNVIIPDDLIRAY